MENKLRAAIKEAMKSKNENADSLAVYQTRKNILETAQKIAKDKKTNVTDSMIYDAAKKEIKQLNDLLSFCSNNDEKKHQISVCISEANNWLPNMVSENEIKSFIENHKAEASNIGAMMKLLKNTFGDSLDGKMASSLVKSIL